MTELKELIKNKGISQKHLAKELGIHSYTLTDYIVGRAECKLSTAFKIADFFGIKTVEEMKKIFKKGD